MQIYVISLRDSHERRATVIKQMDGITFDFFDAVDLRSTGKHKILKYYNDRKTKRLKGYTLTSAELGCFASHYELWQKCIELDQPLLILEDNLQVYGDLNNQLDNIKNLTAEFGIVKLGNIFHRKYIDINEIDIKYKLVSHKKGACGTTAYCISPTVANKYMMLTPGFFEPVDDFMENEWRTKVTIHSYYPNLIARSQTTSVIGSRKDKSQRNLIEKFSSSVYRAYRQLRQKFYNLSK